MRPTLPFGCVLALMLIACGGGATNGTSSVPGPQGGTSPSPSPTSSPLAAQSACNGSRTSNAPLGAAPTIPALTVPSGFAIEEIAKVPIARELTSLPNGDLLVASGTSSLYIVPNAESAGAVSPSQVFATFPDALAAGVAFSPASCTIFVSTMTGVYAMPYVDGQLAADPTSVKQIVHVRTGAIAPNSDGDVHRSTSVAWANGILYVSVGSSCNACVEVDPTRAVILQMNPDGSNVTTKATRIRNAIALAVNPQTGSVWAGGAGQDFITFGHPYEYFDNLSSHQGMADYGWPACEENHVAYKAGADCSHTVAPSIEFPAYSTIIGATFYPQSQTGTYAFGSSYRGGLFVSAHGSWHQLNGRYFAEPHVVFVPMNGDTPRTSVNWNDPAAQWTEFLGGFQLSNGVTRVARSTGVAVGLQGSLFVADDATGSIYRIRPINALPAAQHKHIHA